MNENYSSSRSVLVVLCLAVSLLALVWQGCAQKEPGSPLAPKEPVEGLALSTQDGDIIGVCGEPADQNIPSIQHNSHLGPGSIDIVPTSPTFVSNCIPFGNNTFFGFTGFIYRNVPAFNLVPGSKFAFDLGAQNDVDIRRNIYFAVANINPAPVPFSFDVVSQGIKALGWTKVASDTQIPQNPKGNNIKGDYELIYTAEAAFSFPGGGLIVGFGGSPPGAYADGGCEQVLVRTDGGDASGHFYARFFSKPDQTLGVLDGGGGGTGLELGGIVIGPPAVIKVDIDIKPGSFPNSINRNNKGNVPVALLSSATFDATTADRSTVKFAGASPLDIGESPVDVNGDGLLDVVFHFATQSLNLPDGTTEACLTGKTTGGQEFKGCDSVRLVK